MVKRTHKFYGQVQSDDPLKVANLAKSMLQAGDPKLVEYDVTYSVKSEPFDPDLIP